MILELVYCSRIRFHCNQGIRYTHNVKKGQSKGIINMSRGNSGMPKACKSYGIRGTVVPLLGRVPGNSVRSAINVAGISSTAKADGVGRLRRIAEFCKHNPGFIVHDRLYRIMYDVELFEMAYQRLKSKPGNMTPGITPTTLDGISAEVINNIMEQVRKGSFKFSPGRRVNIPKPNGGTRPLTVAPPRDKLVQEVIRIILEAIYEPSFSPNSHGFRPKKSCHTALKDLKSKFQSAT